MDLLTHWIEDQNGKIFSLRNPFSIGRSRDNTYIIDNGKASRQHALVQARAVGEFWLTDLGSRNGVYLNHRLIKQSIRLKAGDAFQVADCHFTYHDATGLSKPENATSNQTEYEVTLTNLLTVPCWILIADIIGSVRQAQAHTPNIWTAKVGSWIGECRAIIEGQNGAVTQFLGDGFLSHWSSERASAAEVELGLQRLLELQQRSLLPFRVVLHYGPIQFTGISRGEIAMTGNVVNFGFRLEKVAASLGKTTVISRSAFAACPGFDTWVSLGAHAIPGFTEPCELFTPPGPEIDDTLS